MRATIDALKPSAEWIRPGDVRALFGFTRAHCYNLIRAGKLRSVCVRQTGKAFGMRLVSAESIRDFIQKQSGVPTYGKARTRDYYRDNGRRGAKAKAEKSERENQIQKKEDHAT